jgi:predicted N-acetyltransferase YhbS
MPIIRRLTNDEIREAVRLSDATFRDEEQPSMGEAFPFIFSEPAYHVSFGAFEDGKLLSFMGLVPWNIRIGEARLRVFSLGSVCTHPDARGRGIASEVMNAVNEYVRDTGASLLLVSGTRTLYTRAGCARFGRVSRYQLEENTVVRLLAGLPASSMRIREMLPTDLFAMQEAASDRSVRYEFGVSELATLIKSEALASCIKMKHRVLVAEQEGALIAFAVLGVPTDPKRRGILFEYAGNPSAVVQLAGYAVKHLDMTGLDFPVVWQETELHEKLGGMHYSVEDNVGTIMVVDGGQLITQLQPWLESKGVASSSGLRLEQRQDGIWLLEMGSDGLVLTANQLARLLFDCATAEESLPDGAERMREQFPVPFPYTAGLAYI